MSTTHGTESAPEVLPRTYRQFALELSLVEGGRVRCLACARRCSLPLEGVGYCKAVVSHQGELYSTAFGVIGEASVTPIENKPIFHYRPGSRVWSIGGLGCNLRCRFCQNWELAFQDGTKAAGLADPNLTPLQAVHLALARGCDGIAWTFNEPSISPMYVYESAQLAHEAGLFTVYVTNGLMSDEALTFLGPWIDVYRVDVKSLSPEFYERVGAMTHTERILPIAKRAKEEFGIHVETVTNLMPGWNDSDDQVRCIADGIADALGEMTPWHLTSFVPYALMTDVAPTPPSTLARARSIGRRAGLQYVYTDSFAAPATAFTTCPRCGALAIERSAGLVSLRSITPTGNCAVCGFELGVIMAAKEL